MRYYSEAEANELVIRPPMLRIPPLPQELSDFLRAGEPMSKDPLDQPITLRQLKDAFDSESTGAQPNGILKRTVAKLVNDASATDFVRATFARSGTAYTYQVAQQPVRRVQVGDLVTVPPNGFSSQPSVCRVAEINVPPSKARPRCVAISPEDAQRILDALGPIA